jgi:hypothetical protein
VLQDLKPPYVASHPSFGRQVNPSPSPPKAPSLLPAAALSPPLPPDTLHLIERELKRRHDLVLAILMRQSDRYDTDTVLEICQRCAFHQGVLLLAERAHRYQAMMQHYIAAGEAELRRRSAGAARESVDSTEDSVLCALELQSFLSEEERYDAIMQLCIDHGRPKEVRPRPLCFSSSLLSRTRTPTCASGSRRCSTSRPCGHRAASATRPSVMLH